MEILQASADASNSPVSNVCHSGKLMSSSCNSDPSPDDSIRQSHTFLLACSISCSSGSDFKPGEGKHEQL